MNEFLLYAFVAAVVLYIIIGMAVAWRVIVKPTLFVKTEVDRQLRETSLENFLKKTEEYFKGDTDKQELIKACAEGKMIRAAMIRTRLAVHGAVELKPDDRVMKRLTKLSDAKRLFIVVSKTILSWPRLMTEH